MNELARKLQAPFAADEYEWRVQSETKAGDKVNVLCYVTARAIQNRLDEAVGPLGWQAAYSVGPGGGVMCRLSLRDADTGEWVTKEDGAENTDIEAVKGGISGALKRAGAAWGIGRLLYKLDSTWVPLQARGEHYHKCKKDQGTKYWDAPKLPAWAVSGSQLPAAKTMTPAPSRNFAAERQGLLDSYGMDACVAYADEHGSLKTLADIDKATTWLAEHYPE